MLKAGDLIRVEYRGKLPPAVAGLLIPIANGEDTTYYRVRSE